MRRDKHDKWTTVVQMISRDSSSNVHLPKNIIRKQKLDYARYFFYLFWTNLLGLPRDD